MSEESYWLIDSSRLREKIYKNDKNIVGYREYMFIDSGKIVGYLGKEPPVATTVSADIDLAREIMKDYFLKDGENLTCLNS